MKEYDIMCEIIKSNNIIMEDNNYTKQPEYSNIASSDSKSYTKSALIVLFLIGIILGAGGYYLFENSKSLNLVGKRNTNTTKKVKDNVIENNSTNVFITNSKVFSTDNIVIKNQPAGLRVIINSVALSNDGWVAVREDNNGEPGNILGARRFNTGIYKQELIELLRNTVEGETYYAVIYLDDGDKIFNYEKDIIVTDGSGNIIKSKFDAIRIR